MSENILNLSTDLHSRLWSHLLPTGTMREQAAFLFCETETGNDGIVFNVADHIFLHEADFEIQQSDYLELTDETRIWLIKRAHAIGASLAELHSHPGPRPAAFSRSDRIGLKDTVSHMHWRLKNRPYLAIVVAPTGFDALVWACDSKTPRLLDGIDIDGVIMTPTNASLRGWTDD